MEELYSHPSKPLLAHLQEVAIDCEEQILKKDLCFSVSQNILSDIMYICGALHDFGKATSYFQDYILDPEHRVTGPKNHALISAVYVYWLTTQYLSKTEISKIEQSLLSFMCFSIVRRHHGHLRNILPCLVIKPE